MAAAAAAVLAIGGLIWSPWQSDEPAQQLTATEQVIRAEDAQRFEKVIDGARATIVRSQSLGKAVIIAEDMPAAPEGKDFQVWYQNPEGAMVSAGLMPHEAKPTVSMVLDGDASKFTGVGITVEPAGGSTRADERPDRPHRVQLTSGLVLLHPTRVASPEIAPRVKRPCSGHPIKGRRVGGGRPPPRAPPRHRHTRPRAAASGR